MAKIRILSALGAIILTISAFFIVWQAGLPTSPDFFITDGIIAPTEGGLIPPFRAESLQGEIIEIQSQAGTGAPLIINFWATWCVPCAEEMPIFDDLYRAGIPIIGINAGLEDSAVVAAWVEQGNFTFPIIVDDSRRTLEAQFRVKGLPTTFFVDANGVIQYIQRGALSPESLGEGLAAIGLE